MKTIMICRQIFVSKIFFPTNFYKFLRSIETFLEKTEWKVGKTKSGPSGTSKDPAWVTIIYYANPLWATCHPIGEARCSEMNLWVKQGVKKILFTKNNFSSYLVSFLQYNILLNLKIEIFDLIIEVSSYLPSCVH